MLVHEHIRKGLLGKDFGKGSQGYCSRLFNFQGPASIGTACFITITRHHISVDSRLFKVDRNNHNDQCQLNLPAEIGLS